MGVHQQGFNTQASKPFDYYAKLSDLHATQLRVGYTEVEEKRREFDAKDADGKLQAYLESKPVLVVLGPPGITDTKPFPSLPEMAAAIDKSNNGIKHPQTAKERHPLPAANFDTSNATLFVVDHHHESLSLMTSAHDFTTTPIKVVHDYSSLTPQQFWQKMQDEKLLNTNNSGPANSFDDPYRSLARYVRKAGGFEKADALYEEFQWADFFRDKIDAKLLDDLNNAVEKGGVWQKTEAIKQAFALARSEQAKDLPGYIAAAPQTVTVAKAIKKQLKSKSASKKRAAGKPWLIV